MNENVSEQRAHSSGVVRLYRDLWHFAGDSRKWIGAAFALLLTSQLLKLAVPYLTGRAVNTLQQQGLAGVREAGTLLLIMFAVTLASWLLHGPGRVLERNIALETRRQQSSALIAHALTLPLSWHNAHHSGETSHRIRQSSGALYEFAQSQFIYLQNAVKLVGPIIALWLILPHIGVIAVIGYACIALMIARFDKTMVKFAYDENATERRYTAAVLDGFGNVFSVYALRMVNGIRQLIERRLLAIYAPLRKSIVLNEWKWCAVDIMSVALSSALVALYVYMIANGSHVPIQLGAEAKPDLPLGNLIMVYQYSAEAGGVITAIAAHFATFARQQADYASGDIIWQAAPSHLSPVADDISAKTPAWHTLKIRHLEFRHGANTKPSLHDIAIELQRGKRYALIGGSGSGKSTLLRILAGLYSARTIELALDDRIIDAPNQAALALHATATLIPQESEIFEGTLRENLQLPSGAENLTPQALRNMLAVTRADSFVDDLDTHVAERGANWSGGQRQRIALARGVIAAKDCDLLLLDEPTASLDPETERTVYANIFAAFAHSCVVSSIHRLNLLDRFDEIFLLDQGRLLASGSLAQLRANSPEFRALLAAQNRE